MTTTPHTDLRITVLLGGSEAAPLLEALVPLVEGRDAEVNGLFVEDDELLRLAALPFSQELCRLTFAERALDPVAIERQFRIQARLAQRALETATGLERARRSFRSARGTLSSLLKREAEDVDLLVFGPSATAPRFAPRPAPPHVVGQEPGSVIVACTDSPAGRRAVAIGERLARAGHRRLDLLVLSVDEEQTQALVEELREKLRPRPVACRALVRSNTGTLIEAAKGPGTLVIEALPELLHGHALRNLRHGLACPVLLVP